MRKKVSKLKCFSVITKNSDWEVLTKNLVTFKRKMLILRGFTEKSDF